jgi:hypothetical protein
MPAFPVRTLLISERATISELCLVCCECLAAFKLQTVAELSSSQAVLMPCAGIADVIEHAQSLSKVELVNCELTDVSGQRLASIVKAFSSLFLLFFFLAACVYAIIGSKDAHAFAMHRRTPHAASRTSGRPAYAVRSRR